MGKCILLPSVCHTVILLEPFKYWKYKVRSVFKSNPSPYVHYRQDEFLPISF